MSPGASISPSWIYIYIYCLKSQNFEKKLFEPKHEKYVLTGTSDSSILPILPFLRGILATFDTFSDILKVFEIFVLENPMFFKNCNTPPLQTNDCDITRCMTLLYESRRNG